MNFRAIGAIFAIGCASIVLAVPDCLVAQIKIPLEGEDDPNFSIASFVADALDQDGRVRPVVWSLTDPVFREWTSRDVFGQFEPNPSAKQVLDMGRKLGIERVLIIYGFRTGETCNAIAELYVGGRNVWKFGPRKPNKNQDIIIQANGQYDQKATRALQAKMPELLKAGGTFTVMRGGVIDVVETARSVGNTWAALLGDGPFKNLPQRPRITSQGSSTTADNEVPVPDPNETVEATLTLAKGLVAGNKINQAISGLRAGIDRFPFEMTLRESLVETLLKVGFSEEAIEAAKSMTRLKPAESRYWIALAKAHISANDAANATLDLGQALTLGAKGERIFEVEGDLALLKNNPKEALFRYSQLKESGSQLRVAIAQALTGESEEALRTLAKIGATPFSDEDYQMAMGFLDGAFDNISATVRNLLPAIRVGTEKPEVLQEAVQVSASLSNFVAAIIPPASHKESHESRKLAYILLGQACLEAKEFASTNNPEHGDDATASLGQSIRLIMGVREKYRLEQKFSG